MKGVDRQKLCDNVNPELPPGYTCELYDDFLNHQWVSGASSRTCRVLRLVGGKRSAMIFAHDEDPTKTLYRAPRYHVLYVKKNGEAVPFDPKTLFPSERLADYEHVVGRWLVKRGAMSFHGANWVDRFSEFATHFLPRWEQEFSGISSWPD